jgi:hypothetical protein
LIFYHATSKENWVKIQDEGILFGIRGPYIKYDDNGKPTDEYYMPSRCTYLAVEKSNAVGWKDIREVILEVEYDPYINKIKNNYFDDCWQCRVYEPIPIENIKVVEINN